MSKDHNTAGMAFHKAGQALNEIDILRNKIKRKDRFLAFIGLLIVMSGIMLDMICTVLQINHAPGVGYIQILIVLLGTAFFIISYI